MSFGSSRLVQASNGDLTLVNSSGTAVAFSSAPVMFDATKAGPGCLHANSAPVESSVRSVGGRQVLELRPDLSFLADPATVYPVTVDPATTLYASAGTFVFYSSPNTSEDTSTDLITGWNAFTWTARAFVSFNDALIKTPNRLVTSAQVAFYEHGAASCTPTTVNVYGSAPL